MTVTPGLRVALVIATASAGSSSGSVVFSPQNTVPQVQFAVAAPGTFRMSVRGSNHSTAERFAALDSPMVASQSGPLPAADSISEGSMTGIRTSFGAVLFDPRTGQFLLRNAAGRNLTGSENLFGPEAKYTVQPLLSRGSDRLNNGTGCSSTLTRVDCGHVGTQKQDCEASGCCWSPLTPNPGNKPWCFHPNGPPPPPAPPAPPTPPTPPGLCQLHAGMDIGINPPPHAKLNVPSISECCDACTKDTTCQLFVFAAAGHPSSGYDCWTLSGVSELRYAEFRTVGLVRGPVPAMPPPPPHVTTVSLEASANAKFYGAGAGQSSASTLSQTSSQPHVSNTEFMTPHYWTTGGYSALVVSDLQYSPSDMKSYPVSWTVSKGSVQWQVQGSDFDMYLSPASSGDTGLSVYWDLIGRPAVPPVYAFGFMASRWGWKDRQYIHDTLCFFRNGSFPLDAWISDFGWFTRTPDYSLPPQGQPDYTDFGYNPTTFADPVGQLTEYHSELNVRFGGIRKPRLGNSNLLTMAHQRGWTVDTNGGDGGTRNLNFSIVALRDWYWKQHAHYLKEGVDFYWNDEGETYYFAFHWWNMAQLAGLSAFDSERRFWSINRAYTPGMAKLGAVIWTGDISVDWSSLAKQPGYVLNWHMAGAGFITCDTGGFNGGDDTSLLLMRWYQFAVWMPVMRVHSTLQDKPHFPFLYGSEAAGVMREALNRRYQLIPYHYSLAHAAYRPNGTSIMRPLLWSYPNDTAVAEMTTQWFDGEHVMIAPVLSQDNSRSVYLPRGTWYEWNSTATHSGPTTLSLSNVPINQTPVYVRPGAIVMLGPVIQHTGEMPGGALTVHVYTGADGSFTLVEDDGETLAYTISKNGTRSTLFSWDDRQRKLSWRVSGGFNCARCYAQATFVAITSAARLVGSHKLGEDGQVIFMA